MFQLSQKERPGVLRRFLGKNKRAFKKVSSFFRRCQGSTHNGQGTKFSQNYRPFQGYLPHKSKDADALPEKPVENPTPEARHPTESPLEPPYSSHDLSPIPAPAAKQQVAEEESSLGLPLDAGLVVSVVERGMLIFAICVDTIPCWLTKRRMPSVAEASDQPPVKASVFSNQRISHSGACCQAAGC